MNAYLEKNMLLAEKLQEQREQNAMNTEDRPIFGGDFRVVIESSLLNADSNIQESVFEPSKKVICLMTAMVKNSLEEGEIFDAFLPLGKYRQGIAEPIIIPFRKPGNKNGIGFIYNRMVRYPNRMRFAIRFILYKNK